MPCTPGISPPIPVLPAPYSIPPLPTPPVPSLPDLCCQLPPVVPPLPPIPLPPGTLNPAVIVTFNAAMDAVLAYLDALPLACPRE